MDERILHDDMLFDRLVDGELSENERRRLLASLDERPDGWRRCALAFLEAQSWSEDLGQIAREPATSGEHSNEIIAVAPAHTSRSALRRGMAWLAVAASIMAAFTLGLMQGGLTGPTRETLATHNGSPAAEQIAASASPDETVVPEAALDDALTLWVKDDTGESRPVRVPLVDAGALDRVLGLQFQSAIPAAVRERLEEQGYDVRTQGRYAPLWLENGRPMIVPVEDTQIVPIGQNVY